MDARELDAPFDEACPQCDVGRVRASHRPYLKLFQGQLFTIPNALCYECDVCHYHEYDESIFNLMSDMLFGATRDTESQSKTRPIPATLEDEAPHHPKSHQI